MATVTFNQKEPNTMTIKPKTAVINPSKPARWMVAISYRVQPRKNPTFVGYAHTREDVDRLASNYLANSGYDIFIYQLSEQVVTKPQPIETTQVVFED